MSTYAYSELGSQPKGTEGMNYPYKDLMKLPDAGTTSPTAYKRVVRPVDTSTLNPEQLEHFGTIVDYSIGQGPESVNFILLEGYAGTGKTYLTSMFVEHLLNTTNLNIAMTAPTNKAVRVLNEAGEYQHPNLNYATIHKMLGLKEQITAYGEQIFVQAYKEDATIGEYDVLIVDEASMLNDDLLLGAQKITGILEYAQMFNIKVIFVGDSCQIPPIGKENALVFDEEFRATAGVLRLELTTIVRQSADNPIIQITKEVREALGRNIVLPIRENNFGENLDGVYFCNFEVAEDFWRVLERYFTSKNFEYNSNFAKVIAWTNKSVNAFNKRIRKMIYGRDIHKICLGEKLIANKPIVGEGDEFLFTTNDEFEVESFNLETKDYKGVPLTYYMAVVRSPDLSVKRIKIIHEESEETFKELLNTLAELAKKQKKGSWEAAAAWKEFYKFQEIFADVNYNYAITAHKSQGSTYHNVFVIESDIDQNRKIKERNRIKYTAFTRPKHKLFIVE